MLTQSGCTGTTSVKGASINTSMTGTGVTATPSLTTQPASQTVTAGQAATFSVSATGTAPLNYQWQKNGTAIRGAISANYTTPATTTSDNGAQFTVTVSNSSGTITSNAAILTVNGQVSGGPALPTLPQATVDLTMPTQTGTVWNVPAGDANTLQNDINAASCGDTIVLVAGSTYTGNFTIPNKSCTDWVLLESSAISNLPSGTRVSTGSNPPSAATRANLATIVSNVADTPVLTFQTAAHNWRLIGLEITQAAGTHNFSLIETDNNVTQLSQLVNHIIIDRCYVHGTSGGAVRRGLSFQVAYGGVVDSDVREFHDQTTSPGQGSDSQAIAVWSGAGPFLYQNNFLSAASEDTLFGGSDPSISNLIPSDVTVVGNYYWKDPSWPRTGFVVKNIFELKNVQRVLADGNVFQYDWGDGQNGIAILLTPRNQNGGCPWCGVSDITITHNLIQHAAGGFNIAGSDSPNVSQPTNRVLIQNNVMDDINGSTWNGNGRAVQWLTNTGTTSAADNITIDHNDGFADEACLYLGDSNTTQHGQWTNMMCNYALYGIIGNAVGSGTPALSKFVPNMVPNGLYNDVVFIGGSGTYPVGTTFSSMSAIQFTNYNNGNGGNYQLLATSPYHNAGTDGQDIGVWDWTTFNTKTTHALTGIYP